MTRVHEIYITFGRNIIFITDASSDYVCKLTHENGKIVDIEKHGISIKGTEIELFIIKNDIISDLDPIFYKKYLTY